MRSHTVLVCACVFTVSGGLDSRAEPKKPEVTEKLKVTGLSPDTGDADGGTYVVLKGSRFLKDGPRNAKVYFGSRSGTIVRFQSDTELIVQAPGGKVGDVVDLLVIFDPGGQLTIKKAFKFVAKEPSKLDEPKPKKPTK